MRIVINPFKWGHRPVIVRPPVSDPKAAMRAELVNKQAQRDALAKQLAAIDSEISALVTAISTG